MVKTVTFSDVLTTDDLGCAIARLWQHWNSLRHNKISQWEEVRRYRYATDTTTTANSTLPWKNKTTFPKLTQIADNLWANYHKSLFPKRDWLIWEGFDKRSDDVSKRETIEGYMRDVIERSDFKKVIGDLLNDWIETGNCFVMPVWVDERIQLEDKMQVGYVGPKAVRINPLDIVFNPIAPSFGVTPKIIRKWVTLGDLKKEIEALSTDENHAQELWNYLLEIRSSHSALGGATVGPEDNYLQVDGFTDFRSYLGSDYAEVLTFYGDIFIKETGEFLENHKITIVDRHRIIAKEPNPSFFGKAPIYNSGWRVKADNLWAMGPLDNLVGMQYRIDHLENLKADVLDLNAFPMWKIKGFVEDFQFGPNERVYVSEEGDVEMMQPHWEILNTNLEIDQLQMKMEEIAGAPKEAMGIRTPGEKTAYEVQRLENAAGRIFQARLEQFEEQIIEPILTAMLELARRKVSSQELRVFDDELKVATFLTLTANDITGNGRLRPIAARHFAERAERVQNVTAFFGSPVGQDQAINVHYSGLELAKMFEDLLDIKGYKLVTPFVRIAEMQEAQSLGNAAQEQVSMEAMTPAGLTPDDFDPSMVPQ